MKKKKLKMKLKKKKHDTGLFPVENNVITFFFKEKHHNIK